MTKKRTPEPRYRPDTDSRWRTVYDWALHLHPRSFQERFAADMSRTFAVRLAEVRAAAQVGTARPGTRVAHFVVGEMFGLLGSVIRARLAGLRARLTGSSPGAGLPPIPGRGPSPLSVLRRELGHAARRLARSPGFTTSSVLTLGLGIGATTAVYSLVHSIVLEPLPFPDSDRLVWLDHAAPGIGSERGLGMTNGLYLQYVERTTTLEDMAVWTESEVTLGGREPERVRAVVTTPSFLRALRTTPALGRGYTPADIDLGGSPVVISHGLWTRRFGAARDAIGSTVLVNGGAVEVVGVMPAGLDFPSADVDLWAPLAVDPASGRFGGFSWEGIARLAPGATHAAAEAELRTLLPGVADRFGVARMLEDSQLDPLIIGLKDHVVRDAERTLWILLGSVGFVLLLACANVVNLLLVRAEGRYEEAAVRRALGAGRADIARYFLSESFLLSLAGSGLGLLLATIALRVLIRIGPGHLPRLSEVAVSAPAFALAGLILVVTTAVFGLGPASKRGPSLASTVKAGARGIHGGRATSRGRDALVAAQVGLALVLLVATGLMGRSFLHLVSLDPGFDPRSALTFEVGLTEAGYEDRPAAVAFHREALDRMAALPGVEAAGAVTCLPLCGSWAGTQLTVEGRPDDPNEVPGVVAIRRVSEGYFGAAGIRVVTGRLPTRLDQESARGAAVISRELAKDYWPEQDPIGARFQPGAADDDWYTVVGIVDNAPITSLADDPPPMAYLPLIHGTDRDASPYQLSYVLRTAVRPQSLTVPAREVIRALDPEVPIARVRTLEDIVAESNASTAFTTVILGLAAAIALLLGLVGIYGVITYMVGRRSKEIGIRMALGARSVQVSRSVLARGGRVAAVGLAVGLAVALALTRVMQNLLFGVSPTDPLTFAAATAVLLITALLATWIPARRAARVDPAVTLRAD